MKQHFYNNSKISNKIYFLSQQRETRGAQLIAYDGNARLTTKIPGRMALAIA